MRNRHLIGIIVFMSVLVTMLLSGPAYAITNGQPDVDNNWPYVGLLVFDALNATGQPEPAWRCTGSLLSPTVVLCAGHCTDGAVAARVWFDVEVKAVWDDPPGHYPFPGPDAVEAAEIHTHPDFDFWFGGGVPGFITHDVGILVLEEPVYVGEYGELPEESLVDALDMMTYVDQVGYGVQWQERPVGPGGPYYSWQGLRQRHFAPAQLIADKGVISDGFMKLTANPAKGKGGTAFGDSGGPNLLCGTNIILGVTSWGTNDNCAGVSYAQRVDTADVLEWIYSFLE